jgi:hypothetical protein
VSTVDRGPDVGLDEFRRLPSPTGHAGRAREATARALEKVANRLLVVASLSWPRVTLQDLGGTLIDEDILIAGDRALPGQKGVRIAIAGRGSRDAAPAYVFLPIATDWGTPTVGVGVTDGPAAGTGATATVSGTDEFCRVTLVTGAAPTTGVLFTVYWSVVRPSPLYGVAFSGRNVAARNLVAGGIAQSAADTLKCPVGVAVAPAASTQYLFNVFMRDA